MSAESIEQAVRFHRDADLAHLAPTVHRVTEFSTRNPGLWIDGNDWGLTLRTEDGHEVEVHADVILALEEAADTVEPILCQRLGCLNLADPDDTDQACREHKVGRRFP